MMIDAGCHCDFEDGVFVTQEVETLLMNNDDPRTLHRER